MEGGAQRAEQLNAVINRIEAEMLAMRRQYKAAIEARNTTGAPRRSQLVLQPAGHSRGAARLPAGCVPGWVTHPLPPLALDRELASQARA